MKRHSRIGLVVCRVLLDFSIPVRSIICDGHDARFTQGLSDEVSRSGLLLDAKSNSCADQNARAQRHWVRPCLLFMLPLALINKIYDVERRALGMSFEERGQRASQRLGRDDVYGECHNAPVARHSQGRRIASDVWNAHHPEAIRTYRTEERQEKASIALEQAAKRRVWSELRKSLQG